MLPKGTSAAQSLARFSKMGSKEQGLGFLGLALLPAVNAIQLLVSLSFVN